MLTRSAGELSEDAARPGVNTGTLSRTRLVCAGTGKPPGAQASAVKMAVDVGRKDLARDR